MNGIITGRIKLTRNFVSIIKLNEYTNPKIDALIIGWEFKSGIIPNINHIGKLNIIVTNS